MRGQNAEKWLSFVHMPHRITLIQRVAITTPENITAQTSLHVIRVYFSTVPLTCGRIGGTMGLISGGGPCRPPWLDRGTPA